MVTLLIEHGADPHHANDGGHSMLDGAAFSGHAEVARYLITLGVEPSVHHAAAIGDLGLLKELVSANQGSMQPRAAGAAGVCPPCTPP